MSIKCGRNLAVVIYMCVVYCTCKGKAQIPNSNKHDKENYISRSVSKVLVCESVLSRTVLCHLLLE